MSINVILFSAGQSLDCTCCYAAVGLFTVCCTVPYSVGIFILILLVTATILEFVTFCKTLTWAMQLALLSPVVFVLVINKPHPLKKMIKLKVVTILLYLARIFTQGTCWACCIKHWLTSLLSSLFVVYILLFVVFPVFSSTFYSTSGPDIHFQVNC